MKKPKPKLSEAMQIIKDRGPPIYNDRQAWFCYERGPKGWVPKIYWDEPPPQDKPSKGDPAGRDKLVEVTHIAKLYKPTSGEALMEELIATWPSGPNIGIADNVDISK